MPNFEATQAVGEVVASRPGLSRVFENFGIDYCCGGKKSIAEACSRKGVDPAQVVERLTEAEGHLEASAAEVSPARMSLTELSAHIEATHHAFLRSELPRLDQLTTKVARVHGDRDPRLVELRDTLLGLADELVSHLVKEERILFPMIRQLEASRVAPQFHCGSLANPIQQMELEHDGAGTALEQLKTLTDGYQPPEWACNTYRAMVDGLADLERDLHNHIHKENNVLFPKALEMEAAKR
jgi:regulator of cell morphogenesis and NO signaling